MNILFQKDYIEISNITDFDLSQTLDCGQCFRWKRDEKGGFSGVAMGRSIYVIQNKDTLKIYNSNEQDLYNIWLDYFDLNTDYSKIKSELSQIHPVMERAVKFAPGIRILNQEPWEALCSFIISQNNNIPRITGIILRFCSMFGDRLRDGSFTFPDAQRVASLSEEELSPIRCGFRAKYICDAARKVSDRSIDLDLLRSCDITEAKNKLMTIKGVGPKVADCTLLYGLHRTEAFPLDVWMKRAMAELFPDITPQAFGKNAGIAQQYIFHYSRLNKEIFSNDAEKSKAG